MLLESLNIPLIVSDPRVMEIFSQYDLHNIFKIFTDGKK